MVSVRAMLDSRADSRVEMARASAVLSRTPGMKFRGLRSAGVPCAGPAATRYIRMAATAAARMMTRWGGDSWASSSAGAPSARQRAVSIVAGGASGGVGSGRRRRDDVYPTDMPAVRARLRVTVIRWGRLMLGAYMVTAHRGR